VRVLPFTVNGQSRGGHVPVITSIYISNWYRTQSSFRLPGHPEKNVAYPSVLITDSLNHNDLLAIAALVGARTPLGASEPLAVRTVKRPETLWLLDYMFELLRTIHTGMMAVAEWYNFRIPTLATHAQR